MLSPNLIRLVSLPFALVFLMVVAAACSEDAGVSPEATATATAVPTNTPAPTPTPSPQPTSAPLPSPEPTATATASPPTATPTPEGAARLPQDEGAHYTDLEWWYFNGHLAAEDGREFSYHYVTFQSALLGGLTSRLAQLSLADHGQGLHLTDEEAAFITPEEPLSGEFDVPVADRRMSGNGEVYHLSFGIGDYAVELEAVSQKPAVLHYGTGLVDLGIAGKTYYYSRTRLETSGTVSVAGVSRAVTGVSWMDHQWGDFTTLGIGWDWLSLNLDDGSDLTLSVVWEQDGQKHIDTYGTFVPADNDPIHLSESDISLEPAGTWTSSATGGVYPMGWSLRIDSLGLDLTLTPTMEGAEFTLTGFVPVLYWEGSVKATGARNGAPVAGQGFVEMVGYAAAPEAQPTPSAQP